MRIDARNLVLTIFMVITMFAIPSYEVSKKDEIIDVFAIAYNYLAPLADTGALGILIFSGIVALWDGVQILPIRYIELLVALCFDSLPHYLLVITLGKAIGSVITYKLVNMIMRKEDLAELMLSNLNSFYFMGLKSRVRRRPFWYGITIRMFFPSMLNCFCLALLPINLQQFVVIHIV